MSPARLIAAALLFAAVVAPSAPLPASPLPAGRPTVGPATAVLVSAEGDLMPFGPNTDPVGGLTVRIVEQPGLVAVTDAGGHWRIDGIPAGSTATFAIDSGERPPIQTATFVVPATGLERVTFQSPDHQIYDVLESVLGVDSEPGRCHIASTVTRQGFSLYGGAPDGSHGEPGATVTLTPPPAAGAGPIYFNGSRFDLIWPDPSLRETTADGGVLYTNVAPGTYTLEAHKPGVDIAPVTVTCRAGVLTNASPPWGLQVTSGGLGPDDVVPFPGAGPEPPLRDLAGAVPIRLGAILEPSEIGTQHSAVLSREFTALTPENALKWAATEPAPGVFTFDGADAVVAYAEDRGMEIRGHTLVWAQDAYTPAWVTSISDPTELRKALHRHVETVMRRYGGRIHRWDVVNEPLETVGSGPSGSVFGRVLGPDWIADLLTFAHTVDPTAELWINEYGTDWVPGKHEALLALVSDLVDRGVPVAGVGVQMHRPGPDVDRAAIEGMLSDFADLGLKVAITELDVITDPDDPLAFDRQADAYAAIASACLAVAACEELTTWGISDATTWLDQQGIYRTPTRPLLFDDDYQPKPAYEALAEALAAGRPPQPPPVVDTPPAAETPPATAAPVASAAPRFTG